MFQKLKNYIVVGLMGLMLFAPAVAIPAVASAACDSIDNNIASGVNSAASGTDTCGSGNDVSTGIGSLASKVVNIFSIVVGIIAVIMIIAGGFRYITSGGDSNRVSGAKNTLIYAIIGLVIVALAQLIVHYVLNTAAGVNS